MPDALIWGASGGIGSALVKALKRRGWRVLAAARSISNLPAEADVTVHFDADQPVTFRQAGLELVHGTEGIDLAVYAAGTLRADLLRKQDADDWAMTVASNLTGAYLAASHSVHLLNEGGQFVVIGAYVDHLVLPKMGAYAAAKAGLDPMIAILRKEQRKHRFTIVRPGAVNTPFWDNAPFNIPGDAKSPEQVAEAIIEHHLSGGEGDLDL